MFNTTRERKLVCALLSVFTGMIGGYMYGEPLALVIGAVGAYIIWGTA